MVPTLASLGLAVVALSVSDHELDTDIRHLVPKMLPGEPWIVALRLHDGGGEDDIRDRLKPMVVDELKFETLDPSGGLHIARFKSQSLGKLRLRPVGDTILLQAHPDGVSLRTGEVAVKKRVVQNGTWRRGAVVDLDQPGRWKLQLSGVVRFADAKRGATPWVDGWHDVVRLEQGNAKLDIDTLRRDAEQRLGRRDPRTKLLPDVLPWTGGDDDGRVVRLITRPSRGLSTVWRFEYGTDGAFVVAEHHPVRARPSAKKFERPLDDLWLRLWPDATTRVPSPGEGEDRED